MQNQALKSFVQMNLKSPVANYLQLCGCQTVVASLASAPWPFGQMKGSISYSLWLCPTSQCKYSFKCVICAFADYTSPMNNLKLTFSL